MKYTKALTPADEDYKFPFGEELRKLAEEELGETDARRDHALQMLREWAEKNPRIAKIRMDSNFFLKFLRAKKFSIPIVQDTIERYILLRRTRDGQLFTRLDCRDPKVAKLLDLGYMFALPKRDRNGRRVIFYRPGVFDLNEFINEDMLRIHGICYETLAHDEENQIRGVVHAGVGTGIGLQYLTLFSIKEAVRIAKNGERIIPMRHREMHGCNINPALKVAMDLLPKEYGGEMPMAEMIKLWKQELEGYRSTLLHEDQMAVNLHMYSEAAKAGAVSALKQNLNGCLEATEKNGSYGLAGSFRKLEVD
ncbi:hypothetical protein pipiens_004386 [Culex pipiens pipiens]|uniref:CRAL-TRIO domain-containing protein n=1 Tax=Culex pipiens pipiens TaxID=38569 RepID=A0ABD1CJA7_CULPP